MKINLYSIEDTKAAVFAAPFMMRSDAEALRAVASLVADPQTMLCRHPEDFRVWRVGTFDVDTGQVRSEHVTVISEASSLVWRPNGGPAPEAMAIPVTKDVEERR